ncbi:MAG: argininosuccinate lyase [Actinobacteria bacterium]|nr:argininosuccinate lyase [Actinomycetota bacterium]
MALSVSLAFDQRLAADDIRGSRAHVRGLLRAGILTAEEERAILKALDQVGQELVDSSFTFEPSDEDIHTAVERRVTEIAGKVGAKLHTGRSRNDQIATDLRLFTKRAIVGVVGRILDLQQALLDQATAADNTYLPGYTHLQRAQPVLLSHHLLAHGWALSRDIDRLFDARRRLDVSPLGAGALAGSSLDLDPELCAAELGFAATFDNSLDAVSDRDFVAETMFAITMLAVHLSRLGEEIILWATDEFGFIELADDFATGSSMMPQKKNPDIGELVRGKSGRLIGNLTGLLATLKALPLAYNRDLQEDKEPLFDSLDQVDLALHALTGLLGESTFDYERMKAAADTPEVAATDLAEFLVSRGMPFRDAHSVVGGLVRESVREGVPLAELVEDHGSLGVDALHLLEEGVAVQRRRTRGGGGPEAFGPQLERYVARVGADRARWSEAL